MPRVKRGIIAAKRRRLVLKQAKGYRFSRSKKERAAREALLHAGAHAFAHRRDKKSNFRRLWNVQLGGALQPFGLSYSNFISLLKRKGVVLDRKILAQLAREEAAVFARLVDSVRQA